MKFLDLDGLSRFYDRIKEYIDNLYSVFTTGSDGEILTSENNKPVWKENILKTDGDGLKALFDDGTYKNISIPNDAINIMPSNTLDDFYRYIMRGGTNLNGEAESCVVYKNRFPEEQLPILPTYVEMMYADKTNTEITDFISVVESGKSCYMLDENNVKWPVFYTNTPITTYPIGITTEDGDIEIIGEQKSIQELTLYILFHESIITYTVYQGVIESRQSIKNLNPISNTTFFIYHNNTTYNICVNNYDVFFYNEIISYETFIKFLVQYNIPVNVTYLTQEITQDDIDNFNYLDLIDDNNKNIPATLTAQFDPTTGVSNYTLQYSNSVVFDHIHLPNIVNIYLNASGLLPDTNVNMLYNVTYYNTDINLFPNQFIDDLFTYISQNNGKSIVIKTDPNISLNLYISKYIPDENGAIYIQDLDINLLNILQSNLAYRNTFYILDASGNSYPITIDNITIRDNNYIENIKCSILYKKSYITIDTTYQTNTDEEGNEYVNTGNQIDITNLNPIDDTEFVIDYSIDFANDDIESYKRKIVGSFEVNGTLSEYFKEKIAFYEFFDFIIQNNIPVHVNCGLYTIGNDEYSINTLVNLHIDQSNYMLTYTAYYGDRLRDGTYILRIDNDDLGKLIAYNTYKIELYEMYNAGIDAIDEESINNIFKE